MKHINVLIHTLRIYFINKVYYLKYNNVGLSKVHAMLIDPSFQGHEHFWVNLFWNFKTKQIIDKAYKQN